jgi:uncharacterized membrane protein
MKFLQIFNKTPNHKKFSFTPRFYDPQEEERTEREARIRKELEEEKVDTEKIAEEYGYRQRIAGSFRTSKKTANVQSDPSSTMLRLIILLILTVGLIAFLQFGKMALYGVAIVFIPLYLYLKFRKFKRG